MTASKRRLDQRLLWLLLVVTNVALIYYYFQGWFTALQCPFSLGEEGPSMWAAQALAEGANPYPAARLTQHPWVAISYPPLFYYVGSWFFKITGAHLYPLRWLSMASFTVAQLAAYRIFALSGCSRFARILGVTTTACFYTFWSFSFKARVDMLALCLMILAIEQYLVLARKPKDDNIFRFPRLIVIATLITLSTCTKQGAIVVVPAIAAALIVGRQWRLSLFFMWLCTFLISATLYLINLCTQGGFMAHEHFVAQQRFGWHNLVQHLSWLGPDGIILPLAIIAAPIFVIGYFKRQEERDGPYRQHLAALVLASVLLLLSLWSCFYTMGKHSASVSEAMVPMFAAAWLVALASDYMKRRLLLPLFVAFATGFYVINRLTSDMIVAQTSMESAREYILDAKFDKTLMLSEDCALPMEVGADPEFVDLSIFTSVWSPDGTQMAEVLERVRKRQYGAMVLNSNDGCLLEPIRYWDRDFIKTVQSNYTPARDVRDDGRPQDFYLPRRDNTPRR